MANVLMVIEPYWYQDTWVFDDVSRGLEKEPFDQLFEGESEEVKLLARLAGLGLSRSINYLVKDIPNAREGFILLLSSQPIPGHQVELSFLREEEGGFTYQAKEYRTEVWLPPTVLRYFDTAPESIYLKAEPHLARYDRIREVVALRDRVEQLEQMVGKLTLENDLLKRDREH